MVPENLAVNGLPTCYSLHHYLTESSNGEILFFKIGRSCTYRISLYKSHIRLTLPVLIVSVGVQLLWKINSWSQIKPYSFTDQVKYAGKEMNSQAFHTRKYGISFTICEESVGQIKDGLPLTEWLSDDQAEQL